VQQKGRHNHHKRNAPVSEDVYNEEYYHHMYPKNSGNVQVYGDHPENVYADEYNDDLKVQMQVESANLG